ncbi:protein Jumonji [Elysia marginata]|uniref:Protein Jumonji n=1 Tax=Elysia marginata TaxID=1093978 RepID=A0AAV4H2U2_9GAST|nr:protein Jumonji [Elysia marginata]
MVGRRNTLLVTKRSLRNADSAAGKRPKRIVQTKVMEETVGMSRQEEQELNKALYASLQENRRSKSMPSLLGHTDECNSNSDIDLNKVSSSSKNISSNNGRRSLPSGSKSNKLSLGQRRSLRTGMASPLRRLKRSQHRSHKGLRPANASSSAKSHSKLAASLSIDESSQDSARSSSSSANGSKRKIHAQRKFAQGCSLPGTPSSTPAKLTTPPIKKISSRIPKTEDFLTFLCLRGTSVLPPHLDFFNYSREELAFQEESTKSGSSNKAKRQREGTPDSSSTSSGANEEVAEAAENQRTPVSAGKGGGGSSLLAKRSAARASAGTPETARGIISLRQGLQRKVSSTSSSRSSSPRFPVASSSFSQCQAQQASSSCEGALLVNPACRNPLLHTQNRRPKFYFTPEKSPSPSKASGVRPGEFTPPSMHHGSFYFGSVRNFSPLVCRPSTSKSASPRSTPARGLYSSSSSSYPSSSRSSWSSTATDGTPKRRKQGNRPLSREDAGKVIPVCTTIPSDLSVNTHCNLLDSPCHSSLSSLSSSSAVTLSKYQLLSSSNVLSVQQPPFSSVATSSSACLSSPRVAYRLLLHADNSDIPSSHASILLSNDRDASPPLSIFHHSPHSSCASHCHDKVSPTVQSSDCLFLDRTLSSPYNKAPETQETAMSCALRSGLKENTPCSQHTSNSVQPSQTQSTANHFAPLTMHGCPTCNSNKYNSMHYCESDLNLMCGIVPDTLHEQVCHCISNHKLFSTSDVHAKCFQHHSSCSLREEHALCARSCTCSCPVNLKKFTSNVSSSGTEKVCVPVDFRAHVSIPCTSLSGQEISTASQLQDTSRTSEGSYSCKRHEEVINIYTEHNENDSFGINSRLVNVVSPPNKGIGDGAQRRQKALKHSLYEAGEGVSEKQNSQCASDLSDQPSIEGVHFEEYDFAIIKQGGLYQRRADKTKTQGKSKRCEKDKDRVDKLKKKKHKKHRRKKIKVTQAELRIPKLTIRISKKQKVCTSKENGKDNLHNEKDRLESRKEANFQQEFIKMLEVADVPEPSIDLGWVSSAIKEDSYTEQNKTDCTHHEGDILNDEEMSDNPLLDYHGCISESEISFSGKPSQISYEDTENFLTPEFYPKSGPKEYYNSSSGQIYGLNSLNRKSHSQKHGIQQSNSKKFQTNSMHSGKFKKRQSLSTDSACFDPLDDQESKTLTKKLKMRDRIIKAYSKFNKRDTIVSSIEMTKEQVTDGSDLHRNFSTNKSMNYEAQTNSISSGDSAAAINQDCNGEELCRVLPPLALGTNLVEKEHAESAAASPTWKSDSVKSSFLEGDIMSCNTKTNCEKINKRKWKYDFIEDCLSKKAPNPSLDAQSQVLNVVELAKQKQSNVNIIAYRRKKGKKKLRNFKNKQPKCFSKIRMIKQRKIKVMKGNSNIELAGDSACEISNRHKDNRAALKDVQSSCSDLNSTQLSDFGQKAQESQHNNHNPTEKIDDSRSVIKKSKKMFHNEPSSSEMSEKAKCNISEEFFFEKGKSCLIDQILDWASLALTELASKCSIPVEKPDLSNCQLKNRQAAPSRLFSHNKEDKPKRLKRKKRFSGTFSEKDHVGHIEYERRAHKHIHGHRKKKRHKSESVRLCKYCCKSRRLSTNGIDALNFEDGIVPLDEDKKTVNIDDDIVLLEEDKKTMKIGDDVVLLDEDKITMKVDDDLVLLNEDKEKTIIDDGVVLLNEDKETTIIEDCVVLLDEEEKTAIIEDGVVLLDEDEKTVIIDGGIKVLDVDKKIIRSERTTKERGQVKYIQNPPCENIISLPKSKGECGQRSVLTKGQCLQRQYALSDSSDAPVCLSSPELIEVLPGKFKTPTDERRTEVVILDDDSNVEDKVFENFVRSEGHVESTIDQKLQNRESAMFHHNTKVIKPGNNFNEQVSQSQCCGIKVVEGTYKTRQEDKKTSPHLDCNAGPAPKRFAVCRKHSENENLSCLKYNHNGLSSCKQNATVSDKPLNLCKRFINSANPVFDKAEVHCSKGGLGFSYLKQTNKSFKNARSKSRKHASSFTKQLANDSFDDTSMVANHTKKSKSTTSDISFFKIKEYNKAIGEQKQQKSIPKFSLCSKSQNTKFKLKGIGTCKETSHKNSKNYAHVIHSENDAHSSCFNVVQDDSDVLKRTKKIEACNNMENANISMTEKSFEKKTFVKTKANLVDTVPFITECGEDFSKGTKHFLKNISSSESEEGRAGTESSRRESAEHMMDLELVEITPDSQKPEKSEKLDKEVGFSWQENVADDEVVECGGDIAQAGNDIAVHSYGSLNTGQGYAVVNGRFEECQILNKMQLASNGQQGPEKAMPLTEKSENTFHVGEQMQFDILQETNNQSKVRDSPTKSCVPHLSSSVQIQPFHGKVLNTVNTVNTCAMLDMFNWKSQVVGCKEKDDEYIPEKEKQPGFQVSKYAILYQAKPQLKRSIYLQAKDQSRKKQFRNCVSLDISSHPSNEKVKLFQKQISSLEPEEVHLKARPWLKAGYASSSSTTLSLSDTSTSQTNHRRFVNQKKPASGEKYNFRYAFSQATDLGSPEPKERKYFDSSHSFQAALSPTNMTIVETKDTFPFNCSKLPGVFASESMNQCSVFCLTSTPNEYPLNTVSTLAKSAPKSVASLSQPRVSLSAHSSSRCSTTSKHCMGIASASVNKDVDFDKQASHEDQYIREDSVSLGKTIPSTNFISESDKQAAHESANLISQKKAINGRNIFPKFNNLGINSSKTNNSTLTSKGKKVVQRLSASDKAATNLCKYRGQSSHEQSGAQRLIALEHQKIDLRDTTLTSTIASTDTISILPSSKPLPTQGGCPHDKLRIAHEKTDTDLSGHNSSKAADSFPLDLSSTSNTYLKDTGHNQQGYHFDMALSTHSRSLDIDLREELQNSRGDNEHVLDAIMAELKLQIEHLREEISQEESQPEFSQPKKSLTSSSPCYILP